MPLRYPLFGTLSFLANSKMRIYHGYTIGEQNTQFTLRFAPQYRCYLPFCNMGMENPHKHWVYAGSVGGDGEIRTHVPVRANAFRVLFALGTFVSAVVGGGSFGNGENPCAATDFGRAGRY